jgi:hypothetical protein
MDELESLSHTKWDCKYHVVFIPKCRRRTLVHDERARDDVERFVGKVELLYSALTQIDRKPLLDGLASCAGEELLRGFDAGDASRLADRCLAWMAWCRGTGTSRRFALLSLREQRDHGLTRSMGESDSFCTG